MAQASRQRMPEALNPDYIPVDERSSKDLLAFARTLAAEISYYNADNLEDGNWESFFSDEIADSAPHKTLFLSFLELFKYAREHLNTLTRRHLDFYYKEVLRLKEKPATPDRVHVLFQLAKNVQHHLLEAGTLLKAGKDNKGAPLYYATEKDIVINKAEIGSLKTLFIAKNNEDETQNIYAAPVADSSDGLGMPFEEENSQWQIFGDHAKGKQAAIGFAIASPLLFLREGERTIEIRLTFPGDLPQEVEELIMADTFDIQLSGEEGWLEGTLTDYEDTLTAQQIGLAISFNATQPAITAYNEEILGGHFNTTWPLMKISLKDHSNYDLLNILNLQDINLTVAVQGIKNLILQNDQGALDLSKPFLPFGPQPVLGSSFYIGSEEIFQKRLESLTLNMEWLDTPDDFTTHYEAYGDGMVHDLDFSAQINLLYQKSWAPLLLSDFKLFGDTEEITGIPAQLSSYISYERNSTPQKITKYDQNTQTGFIKLELTGPGSGLTSEGAVDFDNPVAPDEIIHINAFGHATYPNRYTTQAIALANGALGVELPNDPYTPTIKSLTLDYTSEQTINFPGSSGDRVEQFFHIRPFGNNEYLPDDTPSLLPQYTDAGTLYIGLKALNPPQQISIFFQPVEGSTAADIDIREEDIHWSYLSNGQWIPLKAQQILSDTTRAFQATGIITFNIPREASLQHSLMPEGFHWLKASLEKDAESAGKFIALSTQAVTAVFKDQGNDLTRLSQAMGANTISGLAERQSAVKGITQPFPSFNGKAAEQGEAFYTRISELLRHKARASSGWDYERLVLEKFSSIYKVKCLNHTRIDIKNVADSSENTAGHVTLITLPDANHKNAENPLEPRTGNKTLIAIGEYIQKYTSPFVEVEVRNPRYEQLQLRLKVSFVRDADQGYHQQLLEEELIRFLSPWAYEDEEDIVFGNDVYKSAVLDFVEKRPYVNFVTDFVLYHIFEAVLPGSNDDHPIEGEQDVHHILHYYTADGETIALDFIAGFNGPADIAAFRTAMDTFFLNRSAEAPLSEIKRADVMVFIDHHAGIAFIRQLGFFHIEGTKLKEDTERAVAARPGAILTSAGTHEIALIDMITHQCQSGGIGIGSMVVEADFIIP